MNIGSSMQVSGGNLIVYRDVRRAFRSTYQYDAEGNLVRQETIATGDVIEYGYDHRNRLTGVAFFDNTETLQKRITLTYDTWNRKLTRRIDQDGDGTTDHGEYFVYDSQGKTESNGHAVDDVIAVFTETYDAAGVMTGSYVSHRYLYGPGVDQILAEETLNTSGVITGTFWTLGDHRGTIRDRVFLDGNGVRQHATHVIFDAFGNIVAEFDKQTMTWLTAASVKSLRNPAGPRYGYTGRTYDADLGLWYYRARWYDSRTGRFIAEDPIFADKANTYRYVGNNATNLTDPSGKIAPIVIIIGGGAIGLGGYAWYWNARTIDDQINGRPFDYDKTAFSLRPFLVSTTVVTSSRRGLGWSSNRQGGR